MESSPVWSPTGESVWFVSDRTDGGPLWSVRATGGVASSLGGPKSVIRFRPAAGGLARASSRPRPATSDRPLLRVAESGGRRRYLLGFTSASDNLGAGPLSIVASRPSLGVPTMQAAQRVRVGGWRSPDLPRSRVPPLHGRLPAPALAPDGLPALRAETRERPHARRPRPKVRLLPGRSLGSGPRHCPREAAGGPSSARTAAREIPVRSPSPRGRRWATRIAIPLTFTVRTST